MNKNDSLYPLIFVIKHFKVISISIIISALLSLIITYNIEPKYRSSAVIFPTSTNSTENVIDNPNFGYDIEADRLLQLLQSNEIKDSVIEKFKLVRYYEIDTTALDWPDILNKKYRNDIKFDRTRYMSIIISANTKKPTMSADIVNHILKMLDKIRNKIYKSNIASSVKVMQAEYLEQKVKLDSLLQIINKTKKVSGNQVVLSANAQYNINLNTASSGNNNSNNIFLEQMVNQYHYEQAKLNDNLSKYEKAKTQLKRPIPSVYIVDVGIPSHEKIKPSYLINLLIAIAGAFFISVSILFLKERITEIKKEIAGE